MQPRDPKIFTVKEVYTIAPGVKHFAFAAQTPNFNFIPGQFVSLHFSMDGEEIKRNYSIATIPGKTDLIEFAAAYVEGGKASRFLFDLKPGDEVMMTGPFGKLILGNEPPNRYVLVATGTGVTPYRTMLPELAKRMEQNPSLEIELLFGVQKKEGLIYANDFIEFAQKHDRFHFHACYSRETFAHGEPHEFCGYVQHYFPKINLNPETDVVYLCGNPHMIDDAFALLLEQGFQTTQVKREKYISSK